MLLYAVVLLTFTGTVFTQNSNNLDVNDLQKQLSDNGGPDLNDLEKKLQENGLNFPGLNDSKINPEKVEKVLRQKCEKQGAGDAVESLKEEQEILKECVTLHLNGSQIQEELEEAKKTGSMDEVFAKYCKKWPDVYKCFENATTIARRCMDEKEIKAFNKSLDILQQLQEFMCFKDGDRLAMFVAEGGVECVEKKKEGLQNCVNSTIGGRFPEPSEFSLTTLPSFLFTDQDCRDFDTIRICVNEELEDCNDTTPANIMDAFFKFLKKQMPCGEEAVALKAAETPSGSGFAVANSILISVVLFLLCKFY